MSFNIFLDSFLLGEFESLVGKEMVSQCDFYDVTNTGVKQDSIFYFRHDFSVGVISLLRNHIEYLSGAKFLLAAAHDHIQVDGMASSIHTLVVEFGIKPVDIYIVLMSTLEIELMRGALAEHSIYGINMCKYDIWLTKAAKIPTTYQTPNKKFSVFSRRYDELRLRIYIDLIRNDLLDESHYTFSDTHPDFLIVEDHKKMKSFVDAADPYFAKISDWIDGIPYEIWDHDNTCTDPFSGTVQDLLSSSHIHICIENNMGYATLSCMSRNSDVLTEKTWKAIHGKKPFLIFGPPSSLAHLRAEGFRSFSPFIHEEYDLIEDSGNRIESITKELVRLNKLSKDDLDHLLEECLPIVEYNYQHMHHIANRPWPESFKKLGIFT
jgi:hypothetical protein